MMPLSWMYGIGIRARHMLYDRGFFKTNVSSLPVVSIGNVVAGGAGKTQAVMLLAEELSSHHLSVAVLSRGYKSRAEHASKPCVVEVNKHSVSLCGDEPWMLASRLSQVSVIVNKNRSKSALEAEKRGAHIVILDDGMQHRKLHRDFEIIVIDGKEPLKGFLPRGRLREDLKRLQVADLILFIGRPLEEIENKVATFTDAPKVIAEIDASKVFDLSGKPIDVTNIKKAAVFCGIGNPRRFVKTIEQLNISVVATHFSSDHRMMKEKHLLKFASFAKARGASMLLCTEKDKVKLSIRHLPLPIGWVRASLKIVHNQQAWLKIVNELKLLAGEVHR